MSRKRGRDIPAQSQPNPALAEASRTVELHGERFAIAGKVGAMAFMRLAKLAEDDIQSDDMKGLAALYDVCEAVFDPESWTKYERLAMRLHLTDEDIFADVRILTETVAARPTGRSGGSPAGPSATPSVSPTVPADAAELVWALDQYAPGERFPAGRPDLAIGVVERWEATHPGEPLPVLKAV